MAKETQDRIIRHLTEWENMFVHNVSEKGLVSKIHKVFTKFNNNKIQ